MHLADVGLNDIDICHRPHRPNQYQQQVGNKSNVYGLSVSAMIFLFTARHAIRTALQMYKVNEKASVRPFVCQTREL